MRLCVRALLIAVALAASPALALPPELTLHQLKHTRWTIEDGAPQRIVDLAQDQEGFLWIGSRDGLYRFDGVTFEKIALSDADDEGQSVFSVLAASDGSIWAGYADGRLAVYRHGVLRDASTPLSASFVIRLLQTKNGAVWAVLGGVNQPLLRYSGGRWRQVSAELGLPRGQLIDARATSDGSLWVTTVGNAALRLSPGSEKFEHVADVMGHAAISEGPHGMVWISDDRGSRVVWPVVQGSQQTPFIPTPLARRGFRALVDHNGNLWGSNAAGVFRARGAATPYSRSDSSSVASVEQYLAADGLTSNSTDAITVDREGDIWVGTSRGLDMFRASIVVPEPSLVNLPTHGFSLLRASDGAVYVGMADAVYRIRADGRPEAVLQDIPQVQAMCEGPNGNIWTFLTDRVVELQKNVTARYPLPPEGDGGIQSCTFDAKGVLWANAESAGLFRWTSNAWRRAPANDPDVTAEWMTTDRNGSLLLLLQSGAIASADAEGHPRRELFRLLGNASLLHEGIDATYVGGVFGLARIDKDGARTLSSRTHGWLRDVAGMVETPNGQTWLATRAGIVETDTAALKRAFSNPAFAPQPTILSFADGLPDIVSRILNRPQVVRGGDGRIWVATVGGVAWIDPTRLPRRLPPPPVVIRALVLNGSRYRDPTRLSLPAGASSLAIEYSGLSLSMPERVRFRYRLDGVDDDWVDAGARREAFYTNLQPGNYRFEVLARNGDGAWNPNGASVAFTIPPTFLQSIWFKMLVGLGLAGLVWFAYTLRLRQEKARLQGRFNVQTAERERIARELHDTLLQSCQGLLLRFQSVANRLPADDDMRNSMEDALSRADAVLAEGRARVRELRTPVDTDNFVQLLTDAASKIIDSDVPRFELTIEGAHRTLNPLIGEEVLRIFEEAIRNVVEHARANAVEVVLTYGRQALRLSVQDNGVGMESSRLTSNAPAAHFGLIGMRERAEKIGGRLEVNSRKGRGTEVVLSASANVAYKRRGLWLSYFRHPARAGEVA